MSTRQLPDLWQKLRANGWLHVTGLQSLSDSSVSGLGSRILPHPDYTTGIGRNNGKCAVYLPDGSVWLRAGFEDPPFVQGLVDKGCHVPCSNGERLTFNLTMERLADPFWNGGPAHGMAGGKSVALRHVVYPATKEELERHPDFLCAKAEAARKPVSGLSALTN